MISDDNSDCPDISKLRFGKEFERCRCLNHCEVRLILADQLRGYSRRSATTQNILRQAYEYSSIFSKIKVRQAVLDLRTVLEKQGELVEFEVASLINLFPRTPEEAKVLLPSLGRLSDSRLSQLLDELESYRIFAA